MSTMTAVPKFTTWQVKKVTLQAKREIHRLTHPKKPLRTIPMIQPRYDEVYFRGLEWLDSL